MAARTRPAASTRRLGYLVALLVNAVLLVLVNRWPGWESISFLTADTELVVGIVNASILAGIAVNMVLVAADPPWLKALGDLVTTGIGLVAAVRVWQVFPFDFGTTSTPWETITWALLVVAIVGSVIGILVTVGRLVAALGHVSGTSTRAGR